MRKLNKFFQDSMKHEVTMTERKWREEKLYESKGIHKSYANHLIAGLVTMGLLKNPHTCESCKKQTVTVAHHEDYFKPLEVNWLCCKCHENRHVKLRKENRDPCDLFCEKILESPEGDSYLNRLHQFYTQVAALSSELFGEDLLESVNVFESTPKLSLSYQDVEHGNGHQTP